MREDETKEYIRIFKDSVTEDLWNSYCSACGISNPAIVKSFRIYYNKPNDIVVDEYDLSGNIIN